jgi:transcriptional regulator with XRE-family HTH domain
MSGAGHLLVRARHDAGLSQRALARRTGVPQSLISAYETGGRQPGADMLLRLLRATGHDVELTDTVERSRAAAAQLEQVCALAMALPSRQPTKLNFPTWSELTR